ncbi:MAG: nitroreductase, partial [Pseudomonadota bacterium]
QNLMLYLHTAGVGTKWTSGAVTREPRTLAALGLKTDEYRVAGLIWIGYARQRTESNRGPLNEVFSQLA